MEINESFKGRIAIVGLDCRLPGADNAQEFWKNLVEEKETLIDFTEEQLIASGVAPRIFNNPNYVRRRGIVKNAEYFDAEFFNFTPHEAKLLDPQHRLFLECSWHALEDAGIDPSNTEKKVAVFGGTGSPYHLIDTIENESVLKYANGTSIITSNDKDYVTTRVSYKLDLKGPSINVQCACSTSMVAVVLGIDSLLNYQADVVLAGGATIELPANKGYMYQTGSLESPDGKCRTFDKDALGTVFSRGCGVVALKRLEDAMEDKDHIYAVILGGSINNDGNRKVGFTAPSVQGQVEVITEAIELAGIDPRSISMVEAHGTSTKIGDPIEVTSLTEAFNQYTSDKQYCAIGSVKTNIGHTDIASGVSSLIKTCLSLKKGIIPASLNYKEPNPAINFTESPFYVNTKTSPWKRINGTPRRALVNAFGVGGTNACVILEEPPVIVGETSLHEYDLLFVSAHNKTSYQDYCNNIVAYLKEHPDVNLNALAHTSRVTRKPMKYKGAIAFKNSVDLLAKLEKPAPVTSVTPGANELVWMFPGQGNQYVNMGLELYHNCKVFRETVDYCATVLQPILGIDLRKIIYPEGNEIEKAAQLLSQTYITQPAIFVISYATAQVFKSYGVKPDALIGHSVGEYVAAAISGIMTLDEALKAVANRGILVYNLPKGSMLAVLMTEAEIQKVLPAELDIAVINSPELVVVSGTTPDIEDFQPKLKEKNIFNKILPTSHAFHSKMMKPCLDEYREFFKTVKLQNPRIPIVSTVTGKILTNEQATNHEYWVQHVLDPVRFSDAASFKLDQGPAVFVECGPGQSLESAIKRRLKAGDPHLAISSLSENDDAVTSIDSALGKLWLEEIFVDFESRFNSSGYTKIQYPLLPFNRKPHMIDFSLAKGKKAEVKNIKKEQISDWYYVPSWKKTAPIDLVPKNAVNHTDLPEKWVVFANSAFSSSLVEHLYNKGLDCFTVNQGEAFEQKGNRFTIRIAERDDYQKVFAVLAKEECRLRIVHTWNFSDTSEEKLCLQNAEQYLEKGFYSLIYLQQGLIRNNLVGSVRISCLVNEGFNVTGNVEIKPEKSLSVGPMRVLFKEHPGITTLLINIETPLKATFNEKLAENIRKETAIETEETIITYSGLTRWTETFEAVNLFRNENAVPAKLKNQGVYLITGGAGGIGRTLSVLIAEKVKATIVWTGRGTLPTKEKWDDLLANDNTEPNLKEKIKTIQQIESMGSVLKYFSVEVSDFEGMKKVVDETESAFGPISGVIHSAGTAGGGVVAFKEKADANRVIVPKVQGTLIIKELFKDKNPGFIYLFSSITALLGEAGRVDYISGNAFMDAVGNSGFMDAHGDVVAVNWGQWGMIGMAADWQREKALRKAAGPSVQPLKASLTSNPINVSRVNSDGNKEVFNVDLNAEKHWVFNEHVLSGMPTLLGASYLDVLVKWKELKGFKENLTIKNGQFVSPLMIVNKASREIQLICEEIGEKQFRFTFSSASPGASGDARKVHFQGEIELVGNPETVKSDISVIQNTIAAEPDRTPHFLYVLGAANKVLLQYSNRWNCKENIYVGENEWLTKLQLPGEFAQDLAVFNIHPAILDVATSAHFQHMTSHYGSFLPYSYGKVSVYRPFEAEMYCHAKLSVPYKKGDEYIHFDFELFNKDGYPVISMKEYAFVKISDAVEPVSGDVTESRTIKIETDENDILPEEGKIILETLLNNDGLSQVIVYTKDLNLDFKESKVTYVRRDLEKKIKKTEVLANADDRPDIDTPYEAPDNEIEKSIAAIWTGILGINKIGATDSFNELGGNSLLAIQVISGIGEEFSIEIQANEFVNNATIRALSDLVLVKILDEHDGDEIESLLEEVETE